MTNKIKVKQNAKNKTKTNINKQTNGSGFFPCGCGYRQTNGSALLKRFVLGSRDLVRISKDKVQKQNKNKTKRNKIKQAVLDFFRSGCGFRQTNISFLKRWGFTTAFVFRSPNSGE